MARMDTSKLAILYDNGRQASNDFREFLAGVKTIRQFTLEKFDSLLAASALAGNSTLVILNEADLSRAGIKLINP